MTNKSKGSKAVTAKQVTAKQSEIVTFSEARRLVKRLGYRSHQAYSWAKIEGRLPASLPKRPSDAYAKAWKGWDHFLGKTAVTNAR